MEEIKPEYIAKAKAFWKYPGYDIGAVKSIALQMQKADVDPTGELHTKLIDLVTEYGHHKENEGMASAMFDGMNERAQRKQAEEVYEEIRQLLYKVFNR